MPKSMKAAGLRAAGRAALLCSLAAMPALIPAVAYGQVSPERLRDTAKEPNNWLTYSGNYAAQRYSGLTQITLANAKNLELKWVYQTLSAWTFEATPLVVDGVMYLTHGPNDVVAVDARTGRAFWMFRYKPDPNFKACCGAANRGLAISGDTLFMGTVDAHVVAIDSKTGRQLWITKAAETGEGYAFTVAPLVVKDTVIVGSAGGDYGARGFIAAYDVATGKERWRFWTVPGPGEKGHETWQSDVWKNGGGAAWVTGSYDPALNLIYWGTGNPGADFNPGIRPGDNLYTCSVVALDADTGQIKWHFQFTPNDRYDYDAVQVPVLADMPWKGTPRKLLMTANKNGFFYVLDRTNGEFLGATPFVKVNWASGVDPKTGRPVTIPAAEGQPIYPGSIGGSNWYSPAFSPRTNLFYATVWDNYGAIIMPAQQEFKVGQPWFSGRSAPVKTGVAPVGLRPGPITTTSEVNGQGAVLALDPRTGEKKWRLPFTNLSTSGNVVTASDVLFTGSGDGYFHAVDATSGKVLWKNSVGAPVHAGPITYMVDGKQYVTVAAGTTLFTFGLRDQ